jgi:hypothetical protein
MKTPYKMKYQRNNSAFPFKDSPTEVDSVDDEPVKIKKRFKKTENTVMGKNKLSLGKTALNSFVSGAASAIGARMFSR